MIVKTDCETDGSFYFTAQIITIPVVERERKEVTRMLKISRSSRNKKLDKEKAGRIAVLAENQENLITAIEEEKLHMSDLEREIRRIEKQIASQRLKAASGRFL